MKNLAYLSFLILLMLSCQSEPDKTANTEATTENRDENNTSENTDSEKTLVIPWVVQMNDSTGLMEIRKDPAADMAHLQPADMVDAINLKYPQIKLSFLKLAENKAFVNVADANYLTQQAGSSGARAYLAEATYALTEISGITAVDFSFKEGDHARPGVYSRADFKF